MLINCFAGCGAIDVCEAIGLRLAVEHPDETMAVVSHADPLQAAWILLDGRTHSERELYRKVVDRAGVLQVDLEGDKPVAWEYIPPPKVANPASAVA